MRTRPCACTAATRGEVLGGVAEPWDKAFHDVSPGGRVPLGLFSIFSKTFVEFAEVMLEVVVLAVDLEGMVGA